MHCDIISVIFAYYLKLNIWRKKQVNEIPQKKLTTYFTLSLQDNKLRLINVDVKFRGIDFTNHKCSYD